MFTKNSEIDTRGMTPHDVRRFNCRQVLKLLYRYKRLSKSQLAALMQLSIPAISNIVEALSQIAWLETIEKSSESIKTGRVRNLQYRISKNKHDIVCFYISPKLLKAIVVDFEMNPLSELGRREISAQTPTDLINEMVALISRIRQSLHGRAYRLALACHGQVDVNSGTSLKMAQAPWKEPIEFKYLLEQRLGCEVLIDNDCVMIALAEKWLGTGEQDYCVINLDYGIGSSFLIGGEIYRGRRFGSGQIGHTTVVPDGPLCGCGRRGCLETQASLKALEQAYGQLSGDKNIKFSQIVERYHRHDPVAMHVVFHSAKMIGRSLYNFLVTLDINQIILYGASCQLGESWLEMITEQTLSNPFISDADLVQDQTYIRMGTLSESELLIGIGYLWAEQELNQFCLS